MFGTRIKTENPGSGTPIGQLCINAGATDHVWGRSAHSGERGDDLAGDDRVIEFC